MAGRPDMLIQYAHHLGRRIGRERGRAVEIRADAVASLNGRPPQRLIDPTIDLTTRRRSLWPADWIVPLGAAEER